MLLSENMQFFKRWAGEGYIHDAAGSGSFGLSSGNPG